MTRMKVFFAIILWLFFLPVWRLLDNLLFLWPQDVIYSLAITGVMTLFFLLPFYLVREKLNKWLIPIFMLATGGLTFLGGSLSKMATDNPIHSHCSPSSFTGTIYGMRGILTLAQQDDLEARNQLCWIRKMIVRMPQEFVGMTEFADYSNQLRRRLLLPEFKYRASLPMIAFLHGKMVARLEGSNWDTFNAGKFFMDSLQFWKDQYTVNFSDRNYPWWNSPYSNYIQFEYGVVENNWEAIIDSFTLETN